MLTQPSHDSVSYHIETLEGRHNNTHCLPVGIHVGKKLANRYASLFVLNLASPWQKCPNVWLLI